MMNLNWGIFGIFAIFFIIIIILLVSAGCILNIIGKWKVFKKAGKNGWEAIIPYYNTWTLVNISGCAWWYFLIIIFSSSISLYYGYDIFENIHANVNFIDSLGGMISFLALLSVNYNISKKFGESWGYAIGLTFVPFIFYMILGFGNKEYNNVNVSKYGFIDERGNK